MQSKQILSSVLKKKRHLLVASFGKYIILNAGYFLPEDKVMINSNVGKFDRTLRIVLGVLMIAGNLVNYYLLGYPYRVWATIGWILLVIGLFRWCPVYMVFRKSTVSSRK